MEHVPAPDFPTGGIIIGRAGAHAAYQTGRGSIVLRAKTPYRGGPHGPRGDRLHRDAVSGQQARAAEAHRRMRPRKAGRGHRRHCATKPTATACALVIELKRDADPDIVLNQLYRHTALQTSFGVNMLALNGGRPEQMTLRDVIVAFIAFREEVITRRTTYLLNKARERAHILVGLLVAVANIDEIIALIRAAPDPASARAGLVGRRWPAGDIGALGRAGRRGGQRGSAEDGTYQLSDEQARAILDLRLQRLTGLEREKISDELQELVTEIARPSRNPALARPAARGAARRTDRDQGAVRQPAAHRDRGCRVRGRYRGLDPARGHGRHGQPRRLHQAGAAVDLSRPAPRRPRPRRHGDPRGGFPQRGVRRLDPGAGAVLHLVGTGLQAQGLPAAARHAAGARPADGQPAAAGRRRDDLDRHAVARGRGELGRADRHVRHRQRLCPAQRALAISAMSAPTARSR